MDCLYHRASIYTIFFNLWGLIKRAFIKASLSTFYPFEEIAFYCVQFEIVFFFLHCSHFELSPHCKLSDVPVAGSGPWVQHGVFLESQFLTILFLLPMATGRQALQQQPWPISTWPGGHRDPSSRVLEASPPFLGSWGSLFQAATWGPAIPKRRRKRKNAGAMHFVHNCLLGNGLGKETWTKQM